MGVVVVGTCSAELKLRQKDRDEPNLVMLRNKRFMKKFVKISFEKSII